MRKFYVLAILIKAISIDGFAQAPLQRITLNPSFRPFYHGVESGDPLPDQVIIWTRVTPDSGVTGNIPVYWQVATDVNFTNIINYGKTEATEENHYCVKEDVCGLQPGTFYYYMFQAFGRNSVIGRTKTAPSNNADNDSARFAVVSCASWEHGYFNVYESISNRNDVDAVLHLGDYIYEYASGDFTGNVSGRTYDPPTEAISEVGYELRYSQYKLDDQLRRIHQLFPFITVWDDHETANNSWREGAENHTPATEGPYITRKNNSTSTYFKWMPIRKPDPNDSIRIFRKLRYGKLLDLIMLDTRLYDRDEQNLSATNDPNRHMMGPAERAWFFQQLDDTSTRWKIIGNQVMVAPLEIFGQPVNSDQWDGYNYERGLIENHILNTPVKDVVFLTGDIHTSWCNDVPGSNYNASSGAGSVCVEFVGTSVTSLNSPLPIGSALIRSLNPHMKYINLDDHGYYILDVKKGKTEADYTFISTVDQLGANDIPGPAYYVNDNERHLRSTAQAVSASPISAANPPLLPDQAIHFYKIGDYYVTIPEDSQVTVNVIPGLPTCPPKTMAIIQGQHGVALTFDGQNVSYTPTPEYHGGDTVTITFCTGDLIPVCDTVYIFVNVLSVSGIDTTTVYLEGDSIYANCVHFDDLSAPPAAINSVNALRGVIAWNDSCFTYTADSTACANDVAVFTGCDVTGTCDTVVYIFKVNHYTMASVIELTLNKNSNVTHCLVFDDLLEKPDSVKVTLLPHQGTFQIPGDSCVKYFPYFNYLGEDSMRFIACDSCGIMHCDTLTVLFHIVTPNSVELQGNLVVFGMYPNPMNDRLVIQYYLYEGTAVTITLQDAEGKLLKSEIREEVTVGLQYAQINTSALAAGIYFVELKTAKGGFRKQVVKE